MQYAKNKHIRRKQVKYQKKKHKKSKWMTTGIFRWEDAMRAYLKFIDNKIITRHITGNPCTLRYTYSYTLINTKTHQIYTKLQIVT